MIPVVFLDANVLFTAAHNPSGKSALIVELGTKGHWRTTTSTLAVEEARRNLDIHFPACIPELESRDLCIMSFRGARATRNLNDGGFLKISPFSRNDKIGCCAKVSSLLRGIDVVASVSGPSCPIDLPKKDQPIFLTALKCRATHLLTGDIRHFGPFMKDPSKTGGMTIMTVSDFLASQK